MATGEQKALCALRLGGHGEDNKSEDRITLKIWNMLTIKTRIAMRSGEEVKIGLVKDSGMKEVKRGGGNMSSHHNKACVD